MSSIPIKNYVHGYLRANRELFEMHVLASVWWDQKFFMRVMPMLCRGPDEKTPWTDDFSDPKRSAVYRAMYDYNMAWMSTNRDPKARLQPIDMGTLQGYLVSYAQAGHTLTEDEVMPAVQIWVQACTMAQAVNMQFMNLAVGAWMESQRTEGMLKRRLSTRNFEGMVDQLAKMKAAMQPKGERNQIFAFGHGIDNEQLEVMRTPTHFKPLDRALGGGFGQGEGSLIIAATGGGKTVFATQMAALMSMNGARGVFISTEQPFQELEPRIVSAICNVPFDTIKDRVVTTKFERDQLMEYAKLRERLTAKTFSFVNWDADSETDVMAEVDSIIERAGSTMGGVDYVIFDWLGKALGKNVMHDPARYRLALLSGATAIVEMAKKYKLSAIAMAQGHPGRCKNNPRVDSTCLTECLTLGNDMTTIVGITTMLKPEAEKNAWSEKDEPTFEEKQSFYMGKARKSQACKVPVVRDFGYQRFRQFTAADFNKYKQEK